MPRITELACATQRTLGAPADPDLRDRRRVRLRGRIVERPELALEVAFALPQCAHQPDRLVRAPAAALERHAHEVELLLVPAHAAAEREPPAGELLQRCDLFRQMNRVV